MADRVDLAVVGAGTLAGRALLEGILESDLPVGELFALDVEARAGVAVEAGSREFEIGDVESFDFERVRLAIFAAGPVVAAQHAPAALDAGCRVIDTSSRFREDPSVPLVIPEINGAELARIADGGIAACPCAASVQLLLALHPLHRAAGIERVELFDCESVSGAGQEALEELGSQTAALLNFRELEPKVLARQVAFNLLPQVGRFEDGHSTREMKIARESRRILGDERIGVNVTAVRVPVFYGHSMAVHLKLRERLDAEAARELLRTGPGLAVLDEAGDSGYPTAVTEASGQDAVFVGRVREDPGRAGGLNLWLVADNLRRGVVANALGCARIVMGDYL